MLRGHCDCVETECKKTIVYEDNSSCAMYSTRNKTESCLFERGKRGGGEMTFVV
jgi:hypothetical protein